MKIAIGIDTGGTCTDAVAYDYSAKRVLAKGKTLTTREDLSVGIAKALDTLPPEYIRDAVLVSLSTTLATNACVEDKGARAKLVIFGLTDELLERLGVEAQYGIRRDFVRCVDTHSSADGSFIDEPDWDALFREYDPWIAETDYMAAAELYGAATGAPCEKRFKALLKERLGLDCVCAGELTDRIDVIQRGATALLNARLLPVIREFIAIALADIRRRGCTAPVMVVRSDGSLMNTDATMLKPVETILSGPSASILAGKAFTGEENYMVVDMGGTTTDVSMVRSGATVAADRGIRVGPWRTSVDGVFVDTFALGGDSTIRFDKGVLKVFPRRAIPLCTAAARWPQILPQLRDILKNGYNSEKYQFHEFFALMRDPSDRSRYSAAEMRLTDALRDGPLSILCLKEEKKIGVSLRDTERLETEGVIMRCGMTPTDFMHIRGDYTEFDREASLLAAEYLLKIHGLPCAPADVAALAEEAYSAVGRKMYVNLVRILLSRACGKAFDGGLDAQTELLAERAWDSRGQEGFSLLQTPFRTDMVLLGMGAPAHVFLPEVAAALGAKCILPDHAEIGNAIGAVMAELIARASVSVTQWDEGGITYLVHTPEGSVKFRNVGDALALAKKTAAELAVREAHLRGAQGELTPKIFLQGNTHNGRGADSLAYGGTVTAEVRYSHLK
jgi:N-methylhydantoinase A/oxoprolinase/acetone carboxylase beta subunit